MKTRFWTFSTICILLFTTQKSQAADLNLFHFRGSGIYMVQNAGNLFTGSLSWNPFLSLESLDSSIMDIFGVRFHFGAMGIKNQTNDLTVAADAQALWVTQFQSTAFELGPGAQYYVGQGGTRLTINANMDIDFGLLRGIWSGLRQLVIGYSALVDTTYFTHQFRLGIGIQL